MGKLRTDEIGKTSQSSCKLEKEDTEAWVLSLYNPEESILHSANRRGRLETSQNASFRMSGGEEHLSFYTQDSTESCTHYTDRDCRRI